jgi:spermidine/putrescine transport system substrate-binding protein
MDTVGPTEGDRQAVEAGRLNRGQFLTGLGVGAAALLTGCGSSASSSSKAAKASTPAASTAAKGGKLNIYSWPNYFSAKNLSGFKQATGTGVNVSTYQSNDAMFAKLAASGGNAGFDMAIPTSGWLSVMAAKGMLQKIDHARVPFANIDPQLLNRSSDPNNQYSVPKDYGYSTVVYDPAVVGKKLNTWMDFIDAAKGPASGKVALEISYGTIAIGLWALGYSMNTQSTTELNASANLMKTVAPHVKTFSGFDIAGCVSGQIAMMSCDQSVARQVLLQNKKFVVASPGPRGELWVDNYTILAGAADTDQAYSFIDYQLKPTSQVIDTEFIGYPTPMKGLKPLLPKSLALQDVIFIPPKVFPELETFVVHTNTIGMIENLANQVQAA